MPISIYDSRVMDEVVRALPEPSSFFRKTFFNTSRAVEGFKIDVDFFKGKRRIAPFVNPKSAAKVVEKIGYTTNTFEIPLLKPKDVTSIQDLSVRLAGEGVYNSGMTQEERALTLLTEKLAEFDDSINRRIEWMGATAMFTGKIPVIGEGVNYEIDFGFTNKEALSGAALWSASTSDPLGDIDRWVLVCQQKGYHTPNVCVMASDAYAAFTKRLVTLGITSQLQMNVVTINPVAMPENVVFGGTLLKYNMKIYVYNEWYIDDWTDPTTPVEKSLVPAKTVLLGSTNAKSKIYFGELILPDESTPSKFRSVIGEKAAQTWTENDPAARYLAMHSRPLTAPQEVDSWYVGTVL